MADSRDETVKESVNNSYFNNVFSKRDKEYDTAGAKILWSPGTGPINLILADKSGGRLYTGNMMASRSKSILRQNGITRIVNCTRNMKDEFDHRDDFSYHRFIITNWSSDQSAIEFFEEAYNFIDEGLQNGENTLVHCLAGAHRAGATTVATVMKRLGYELEDALKYSSEKRKAIAPFGSGLMFLKQLDKELKEIRTEEKIDDSKE